MFFKGSLCPWTGGPCKSCNISHTLTHTHARTGGLETLYELWWAPGIWQLFEAVCPILLSPPLPALSFWTLFQRSGSLFAQWPLSLHLANDFSFQQPMGPMVALCRFALFEVHSGGLRPCSSTRVLGLLGPDRGPKGWMSKVQQCNHFDNLLMMFEAT